MGARHAARLGIVVASSLLAPREPGSLWVLPVMTSQPFLIPLGPKRVLLLISGPSRFVAIKGLKAQS
jgi:hypothetical protein